VTVVQSLLKFWFHSCVMVACIQVTAVTVLVRKTLQQHKKQHVHVNPFLREGDKKEMLEHPQKSFQSMIVVKKDSC